MAKTLQLSDAQQSAINRATYPLDSNARKILRERVLAELEAVAEIGDGNVYRTCRSVQQSLWEPPGDADCLHGPRVFQKLR